jgi:hypothetical protein
MSNVFNIKTFVGYLTYFLKMGIFINKGTDKEKVLDKCIKLYNKYKIIENSQNLTPEEDTFVRRTLKRFNLVLKVNEDGSAVNVRIKENQSKILDLDEHKSLKNNNLDDMIIHAQTHNIDILPDIPFDFILRQSAYRDLLWGYTRALFYISQIIISDNSKSKNSDENTQDRKTCVHDSAMEVLETIIESISELEEKIKVNNLMALDNFLNSKLVKTNISDSSVSEATLEVREILKKKGLSENKSVDKMINAISTKLPELDLSQGNIIQGLFGIAQNVAHEISEDLMNDPAQFKQALGAITEVFQEAMSDPDSQNEAMPPELNGIFSGLISMANMDMDGPQTDEEIQRLEETLDEMAMARGVTRDELVKILQTQHNMDNSNGEQITKKG